MPRRVVDSGVGDGGSKRRDEKQGNVSLSRHKAVADEIATGEARFSRRKPFSAFTASRLPLSSRVKSRRVADDSSERKKGLSWPEYIVIEVCENIVTEFGTISSLIKPRRDILIDLQECPG